MSPSLYAGKGNSDCPRRDNNVVSTSNSYDAGEGHINPSRMDNDITYTFSGQEGGPKSVCGGWGRALSSLSSYAGKGDSNHPRRDDNVASTLNSYGAGEGDSDPPRTDNVVAYTISGQEGRHPGGVVGVDNAGSRSVAGGASSISMHKTCKLHGTYGTRSVAGGASSISMHETRKMTTKLWYTDKDHPKCDSPVTINALFCKKVFSLQEGIR